MAAVLDLYGWEVLAVVGRLRSPKVARICQSGFWVVLTLGESSRERLGGVRVWSSERVGVYETGHRTRRKLVRVEANAPQNPRITRRF